MTGKMPQEPLEKILEQYRYAILAGGDAIWEMDAGNRYVRRSSRFNEISGYCPAEVVPSLEWFMGKIHPQDRTRIKTYICECLDKKEVKWENEYRFQTACGGYSYLLDKAYAVYENGRLLRVTGIMRDVTEKKKLAAMLVREQLQKQKDIRRAIIKAEEKERSRITVELHDNVNQLLVSAKLLVGMARRAVGDSTELMEKTEGFLGMAIGEIRELTRRLSSSVIMATGLYKSITDIIAPVLLSGGVMLELDMAANDIAGLSPSRQLMVYRIIQEQTSNILKYAQAEYAFISLEVPGTEALLVIRDTGKGFDKNTQFSGGIGLINIFSRVDACGGTMELDTSPGNGCTLTVRFPLEDAEPAAVNGL